jgi:hypothetical protein
LLAWLFPISSPRYPAIASSSHPLAISSSFRKLLGASSFSSSSILAAENSKPRLIASAAFQNYHFRNILKMPVADRMNWDASADQNLLICVIDVFNPSGDQLRAVQAKMTDMGYNCSVKAVSYCSPHSVSHLFPDIIWI